MTCLRLSCSHLRVGPDGRRENLRRRACGFDPSRSLPVAGGVHPDAFKLGLAVRTQRQQVAPKDGNAESLDGESFAGGA
jgi:hypothetical protein